MKLPNYILLNKKSLLRLKRKIKINYQVIIIIYIYLIFMIILKLIIIIFYYGRLWYSLFNLIDISKYENCVNINIID